MKRNGKTQNGKKRDHQYKTINARVGISRGIWIFIKYKCSYALIMAEQKKQLMTLMELRSLFSCRAQMNKYKEF